METTALVCKFESWQVSKLGIRKFEN